MRRLLPALLLALVLVTAPAEARHAPRAHPAGTARPWSAGFERGLGEWSWWGQGQQSIWGHVKVIDPTGEGVPRFQARRVVRFETTPDDIRAGRTNAKIYRYFRHRGRAPRDVSGTYRAWFYFPRTYHVGENRSNMIFQFKEEWTDASGWHQDPQWWVELDPARTWGMPGRPSRPVAFIHHPDPNRRFDRPVPVPLGRWVELKARIVQHRRIDVWLDGRHLGTGRQSAWPVGPAHGSRSSNWIFGVGNYSQDANGPLYVDAASYRR